MSSIDFDRSLIAQGFMLQTQLEGLPSMSPQSATTKRLEATGTYYELKVLSEARLIRVDPSSAVLTSEQIFEREKNSFIKLEEKLLNDEVYVNKYVAIINGQVADSDYDRGVLVERIYTKNGYIPLFVGKITKQKRYRELPSPERA